jgi:hypothetical protein
MIDVLSVVAEVDLDPTYLAAELFWRWVETGQKSAL